MSSLILQSAIYKDVDLNPPPIRNGVTGVIGAIWFFGSLFLFGIIGLLWAFSIAFFVLILLIFGLRSGILPIEWNVPYFLGTCPNCHYAFPFFMNSAFEDYHPERNHTYNETCDNCGHEFILNYEYTGRYDSYWDKIR